MGSYSIRETRRPHAVCVPFPAQGHINPMMKTAVLLHHNGFHITFVNTEYNHNRLRKSQGPAAVEGLPDFQLATIPDGLPPAEDGGDATQDIPSLCFSTRENGLDPLNSLIDEMNGKGPGVPPVSCVVADTHMTFALDAAERIGVPGVLLQVPSACSLLSYMNLADLRRRGLLPPKDKRSIANGYLETPIDWIPGMIPLRLKDFPFTRRTTDPDDPMLNFLITETSRSSKAKAIITNTFQELEQNVLNTLSSITLPIYTLGPLNLMINRLPENSLKWISTSLWKEEPECLKWLDSKPENSVLYINFGSITVLTRQQLHEFALGLAESKKSFLWIVRPDLVQGENTRLPRGYWEGVGGRGFVAGWAPQEEVLKHQAVGGFLTHNGWNSTMESLSCGVPMLCWPFFADQRINCRYVCEGWGVGMEINSDVKREELGFLFKELLDGERGERMRKKAMEWKEKAEEAIAFGGSSSISLNKLVESLSV